jgi:hypothetical protein
LQFEGGLPSGQDLHLHILQALTLLFLDALLAQPLVLSESLLVMSFGNDYVVGLLMCDISASLNPYVLLLKVCQTVQHDLDFVLFPIEC